MFGAPAVAPLRGPDCSRLRPDVGVQSPVTPPGTPSPAASRLTWSNALTSLRLVAAPIFFCTLLEDRMGLACALFWIAVATDVADGRLARARGESSAFGGLLDHATDASFVSLGLAALALQGVVPFVLPVLVALAFIQYMLDSKSLAGRHLRASRLGRWNGILYFVPLGIVVTREALGLSWPPNAAVTLLAWGLVLSTVVSVADRAWSLLAGGPAESVDD